MRKDNYEVMESFTLKNIPSLDTCVLGALELFSGAKIPRIKIPFKRPLVVGSGNAEATGRILFEGEDCVFANESNFLEKLRRVRGLGGVVVISASGQKHAPLVARHSKKRAKRVVLITSNPLAPAGKFADKIFVFPKQREPYTYNTSTYLAMILGKTLENPKKIHSFIKRKIEPIGFSSLGKFKKYYLLVPPRFSEIRRMFHVKFIELFGREIARDVETTEYVKHATTVVPSKDELFISFGERNRIWGRHKLNIPLSRAAGYGEIMAVGYYVIGKIQEAHKPYFKKNIERYCKEASRVFRQKISPIVE